MLPEQQRAHLRMLATLPVRTHHRREPAEEKPRYTGQPKKADTARRREQIRALLAEGVGVMEITRRLEVSRVTVRNHKLAIQAGL